jgi:hypothetical protein
MGGAHGGRRCRGDRALWVAGIGPGSSCGGGPRVKETRDSPAARSRKGGALTVGGSTAVAPSNPSGGVRRRGSGRARRLLRFRVGPSGGCG